MSKKTTKQPKLFDFLGSQKEVPNRESENGKNCRKMCLFRLDWFNVFIATRSNQEKRTTEVPNSWSSEHKKKRKCHLNVNLKSKYPFLIANDQNGEVIRCNLCLSVFSIASGGHATVKEHLSTEKHKAAEVAASSSGRVSSIYKNIDW